MKKIFILTALFIFSAIFSPAAHANDATATIGIGGIKIEQTNQITMESEALFISAKEVKVDYKFKNTSTQDITTLVAFPMPTLFVEELMVVDANVNRSSPINFINFKVQVDSSPVAYKTEVKALVNNKDVTKELQNYKIPLSPFDKNLHSALKNLPLEIRKKLKAENIINGLVYKTIYPNWKLKITFYWQQTFPAGKILSVSHQYQPVAGLTFWSAQSISYYRTPYCIDTGTERALKKKTAATQNLFVQNIQYVLKTGANWKGPIKDFKLTVDKGNIDNIISLCATGVKKIGPTTFTMNYKNFVPKEDIKILIVGKNSNL